MVEIDVNIAGGQSKFDSRNAITRKPSLGPLKKMNRSQSVAVPHKKHSIIEGNSSAAIATTEAAKGLRKLSTVSVLRETEAFVDDKHFFGDDTAALVHFHNPLLSRTKPNNSSVS